MRAVSGAHPHYRVRDMITVEEAKTYLRVDSSEEDTLIEGLLKTVEKLCRDILRDEDVEENAVIVTAKLYALAYLYEHREEADHGHLIMTLRTLLSGERREVF